MYMKQEIKESVLNLLKTRSNISINDMIYNMNDKQYSEKMRRTIQNIVQHDENIWCTSISDYNTKLYCLKSIAVNRGYKQIQPRKYSTTNTVLRGINRVIELTLRDLMSEKVKLSGINALSEYMNLPVSVLQQNVLDKFMIDHKKKYNKYKQKTKLSKYDLMRRIQHNVRYTIKQELKTSKTFKSLKKMYG